MHVQWSYQKCSPYHHVVASNAATLNSTRNLSSCTSNQLLRPGCAANLYWAKALEHSLAVMTKVLTGCMQNFHDQTTMAVPDL